MAKILYLCQTLGVGGAEQLLLTTIKYLDRRKFSPVVYCLGRKGEIGKEIEGLGVKVTALEKKSSWRNIEIISCLVRIFKKEKPDILHANLFYPNCFGRIAAIIARVPVIIITEHGARGNFKNFFHHAIDFILSFFTHKIIAVSIAVKKYLLGYSLISPDKIAVIYNTIDIDKFKKAYSADKSAIRRNLGFADTDVIIGSVSNLAPWKGQYFLLQAFAKVQKFFPKVKLCVVGRNNANFQGQLEALAKVTGISSSVFFLGERRDIPNLMRAFDIFVFPSLTEGLGVSLLEAMYMGLPAIASDVEGISEVIEDNKDGFLVAAANASVLADKISCLLADKDRMKSIGLKAREKIGEVFSPAGYLKKLEAVYNGDL